MLMNIMLPISILCIILPKLSQCQYNERIAKEVLLPLSAATYSKRPFDSLANVETFVPGKVTKTDCLMDSCVAITAISEKRKIIVVAFRGTSSTVQLLEELIFSFIRQDEFECGSVTGLKANTYFFKAFTSIWNNLRQEFKTLTTQYPDFHVYLTGHSLGGALASLASFHIACNYDFDMNKVHVYTFGQPRIGNKKLAIFHNKMIRNSYRIINRGDPIPNLPYFCYHHHAQEIMYKEAQNMADGYRKCDQPFECSTKYIFSSFSTTPYINHHYYLGEPMGNSTLNW